MISIIICSRDIAMLGAVSQDVAETIGAPYEIIAIDNSQQQYGICEAYNNGAAQAKYEYLCFMHEDLKFHTNNWGAIVINTLVASDIGVLGVAGGTYQAKAPVGWTGAGPDNIRINVLHTTKYSIAQYDYWNPVSEKVAEVATLDGLWMCCRKAVWQEFPFDSEHFPHFHFYDIDFCTRVHAKYRNLVTFELVIEHFSGGTYGSDWLHNAVNYYKRWKDHLPFGLITINPSEVKKRELAAFQHVIRMMLDFEVSAGDVLYSLLHCLRLDWGSRDTWWLVKQHLKKAVK
jgi:glycosyltransferase involved in cell wall biosynthesis